MKNYLSLVLLLCAFVVAQAQPPCFYRAWSVSGSSTASYGSSGTTYTFYPTVNGNTQANSIIVNLQNLSSNTLSIYENGTYVGNLSANGTFNNELAISVGSGCGDPDYDSSRTKAIGFTLNSGSGSSDVKISFTVSGSHTLQNPKTVITTFQ